MALLASAALSQLQSQAQLAAQAQEGTEGVAKAVPSAGDHGVGRRAVADHTVAEGNGVVAVAVVESPPTALEVVVVAVAPAVPVLPGGSAAAGAHVLCLVALAADLVLPAAAALAHVLPLRAALDWPALAQLLPRAVAAAHLHPRFSSPCFHPLLQQAAMAVVMLPPASELRYEIREQQLIVVLRNL